MSLKFRIAGAAVVALTLVTAACSDSTTSVPDIHSATLVRGNNQRAAVGQMVGDYLVVQALDENGRALAGVHVTWTVTSGGGEISDFTSVTDSYGYALAAWRLGATAGTQTVTVTLENVASPVVFNALAEIPN